MGVCFIHAVNFSMKRTYGHSAKVVGIVTAILFLVATAAYVAFVPIREEVIFVLSALAGWGAVYSAYFVGETLRVQIAQKDTDLRQQRIDRSFALKAEFDDPQLIAFRTKIESVIRSIRKKHTDVTEDECARELYETIVRDPEALVAARSILNKIESASLAVQFGNADEEVLYRDLSTIIINTYRNLEFFVESRRARTGVRNADRAFREAQKLVESWEREQLLSTTKQGK